LQEVEHFVIYLSGCDNEKGQDPAGKGMIFSGWVGV